MAYIAFAECPEGIEQAQIVAGQLADYLITIEGIRCSFLFYHDSKTLRISARSDGSVNVQVVMEKLGGGGHMTVSGAQLKEMQGMRPGRLLLKLSAPRQRRKQHESSTSSGC